MPCEPVIVIITDGKPTMYYYGDEDIHNPDFKPNGFIVWRFKPEFNFCLVTEVGTYIHVYDHGDPTIIIVECSDESNRLYYRHLEYPPKWVQQEIDEYAGAK